MENIVSCIVSMMVSCIRDKMIFIHSLIDFYDFQIKFLQEFPEEAGKKEKKRILPYMPGPLDTVNDEITGNKQMHHTI